MYKLVVFVPDEAKRISQRGIIRGGGRSAGCLQSLLMGVSRCWPVFPGNSSNPHIGSVGMIEQVDEWRIEMLVSEIVLEPVKNALYDVHPYEEPAFDLIRLEDIQPRT